MDGGTEFIIAGWKIQFNCVVRCLSKQYDY